MASSNSQQEVKKPNPRALRDAMKQYMLLNVIGKGNQGTVYFAIARDALPPRKERTPEKLLKLLQVVKIDHHDGAAQDNREIRALSSSACSSLARMTPWVPKLHRIDAHGQWMATSYAGISLGKFCDMVERTKKTIPIPLAWLILKQLLKIFAYLHSGVDLDVRKRHTEAPKDHKAITHSDLIVDNVCVRPQGNGFELVVIDFGWGKEHPMPVTEGYSCLAARKDVFRIAEIVHWFLHRQNWGDDPDTTTGAYCHCLKYNGYLRDDHAEIIVFMNQFACQDDPEMLTAAQALEQMDAPGFWDNKEGCRLPLAWKKVTQDNSPDGDNLMHTVELFEDWQSGAFKSIKRPANAPKSKRWVRTVRQADGQNAIVEVQPEELNILSGKHRRHTDANWAHLMAMPCARPKRTSANSPTGPIRGLNMKKHSAASHHEPPTPKTPGTSGVRFRLIKQPEETANREREPYVSPRRSQKIAFRKRFKQGAKRGADETTLSTGTPDPVELQDPSARPLKKLRTEFERPKAPYRTRAATKRMQKAVHQTDGGDLPSATFQFKSLKM